MVYVKAYKKGEKIMAKEFITDDLAGDLEVLFPQRDLSYGDDGNLYSDADGLLAYVEPLEKYEDGISTKTWKCRIA